MCKMAKKAAPKKVPLEFHNVRTVYATVTNFPIGTVNENPELSEEQTLEEVKKSFIGSKYSDIVLGEMRSESEFYQKGGMMEVLRGKDDTVIFSGMMLGGPSISIQRYVKSDSKSFKPKAIGFIFQDEEVLNDLLMAVLRAKEHWDHFKKNKEKKDEK